MKLAIEILLVTISSLVVINCSSQKPANMPDSEVKRILDSLNKNKPDANEKLLLADSGDKRKAINIDSVKVDNQNKNNEGTCNCVPVIKELDSDIMKWLLVLSPFILSLIIIIGTADVKFNFNEGLSETSQIKKTIKNPEFDIATISELGSSVPNLSTLLPPTIEVSQSWPSLYDLFIIVQAKEKAFEVADGQLKLSNFEYEKAKTDENIDLKIKLEKKVFAEKNIEIAKKEVDAWKSFYNEFKEPGKNSSTYTYVKPSISRYIAFITFTFTIIFVVCISSFFLYHYIRTGCPPDFGALTVVLIALLLGFTPYLVHKITRVVINQS